MSSSANANRRKNSSRNRNRSRSKSRSNNNNSNDNGNGNDKNKDHHDNMMMLSDDIPQFANFADFTTNHEEEPQARKAKSKSNHTNGNSNGYSHGNGNRHSSPPKGDRDRVHNSNSNIGAFDSEAASDYKWAKMQATSELTKTLSPIKAPNQNSSIRMPNAGLIRSISASGRGKSNGHGNGNGHGRRERSISPEQEIQHQHQREYHRSDNNIPSNPKQREIKTRARSKSPAPHTHMNNNNNNNNNRPSSSSRKKHHNDDTPTRNNKEQRSNSRSKSKPKNRNKKIIPPMISTSKRNKESFNRNHTHNQKQHPTKEEIKIQKYYATKSYTFQNPLHQLVSYRVNDLASRIAFEQMKPVTIADLEAVASKRPLGDGGSSSNNNSTQNRLKRISPSPQYLKILDIMSKVSYARQLCWSPSVSREADPFYGWGDDSDDDVNDSIDDKQQQHALKSTSTRGRSAAERERRRKILLKKKRKQVAASKIGLRCTQIDSVEYIQDALLDHAPLLTNIRRRLPMRSDVGFPRATEREINMKQNEIAKEAQLEEVSPRLVVMIGSDDVGSTPELEVDKIIDQGARKKLKYSLPGMPYAGKELTTIRKMQKRSSVVLKDDYIKRSSNKIKPDPSSMFAPPIDSIISSTEMWRSRPFSDRPTGLSYAVAIPLDVRFAAGSIEPLVCTLALYCLPQQKSGEIIKLKGKISEDYVFPAGEWGDFLEEKAGEIIARKFGITKESTNTGKKQRQRPKKALFSFDPMALSSSESDNLDSLYLVMNVHKVTHQDAGIAYMNNASMKNMNYNKNTISGFFWGASGSSPSVSSRQDTSSAKAKAKNAFDAVGSQFLTPFCFGILPLFPNDPENLANENEVFEWPNGTSQSMVMFSHPMKSESQNAFVDRITLIAQKTSAYAHIIDEVTNPLSNSDSMSFDDDSNIIAVISEESMNSRSAGSRSKLKRKRFKFKKRKANKRPLIDMAEVLNGETSLVDGSAIFYTSRVGVDFSQTLLQCPPFLEQEDTKENKSPRLLVDVSGDCAIMVNPEHSASSRKKRSNLIRLPPSSKLSGYSDSSEVREVLYLPFQSDIQYDTAPYLSPRTSLNLLYIYPRLIRKVSSEPDNERCGCYSVRIRLVQQELEVDEVTGVMSPVYIPNESIYNPAPGGESLLQAVYTKIPLGSTGKNGRSDVYAGIYLQDEVKVRLPMVLDGSQFLQFTLYSVDLKTENTASGGLIQNFIGDTYIPLSSSSTKESTCGKRVTTVIPNGLHRIEIGSYQLQVVTRLVSTIHISDPAVATVVRDFAGIDDTANQRVSEDSGDVLQLSRILSKASVQSAYSNFHILVFIHLRAFIKIGSLTFDFRSKKNSISTDAFSKMEYLRSMFKLINKTKKRFVQLEDEGGMSRLTKAFLDTFDEETFHPNTESQLLTKSSSSHSMSNISIESDQDFDILSNNALNKVEERIFDDATGKETKPKFKNYDIDEKGLYARYADNAVPFSRKAYGNSKIDRMKAEAELYEAGQMLTELYDDDETVVTASTWHSQPHISTSATSFSIQRPSTANSVMQASISQHMSPKINFSDTETIISSSEHIETPFEKARSMANRVNLVAQIFMAPCTAPNILHEGSIQSPDRRKLSRIKRSRQPIPENIGGLVKEFQKMQAKKEIVSLNKTYFIGSDVEEEEETDASNNGKFSPYPNSPSGARLRGIRGQLDELTFCVPDIKDRKKSNISDPYVYEIIFTMWIHSSKQQRAKEGDEKGSITLNDNELFIKHMDFLLPLCLKSLALRCLARQKTLEIVPSLVLDMKHMQIIEPLVETIAKGFVNQVLNCDGSVDLAIVNVLTASDTIIDFFIGLLTFVHPSQVSWFIFRYLETLRFCEEDQETSNDAASIELTMTRIRVNRQLRLRAAEKLASMPRFVALNFPYKFHSYKWEGSNKSCSWTNQMVDKSQLDNSTRLLGASDGVERLPETNWLAELLSNECFIICYQSCEAIVNGTISQASRNSSMKKSAMRQRITISKQDMAHHHSIGYHSISVAYDLVLRMHATDYRYQSEEARSRIAGIFVSPVIENTLQSIQWLSKMEAGSKVRNIWLLCMLYVLQEAPETALRQQMHAMCIVKSNMKESRISRFIRILKLCTMTFQSFTNTKYLPTMAPWLVQESFNTISASAILLVDECYESLSQNPYEQTRMVERTLDLLLHIISAPLSSVTLLRALGAVSQVLDKVGTSLFLDAVEDNLQHWGRIIFSMMNNTSLSVRSMAVDLTVSLFGSLFKEDGNIDEVAQVFLTVLPEVVAREIALYSVDRLITTVESVECSLWPLRRALADIEEANPLDDDRVDSQLSPFLGQFCRACQAVIDGVLIELRLQGNDCQIVNTKVDMISGKLKSGAGKALPLSWAFDADEESVYEAASSFVPETSPLQRIRWLLTLKRVHEVKGQWVEAGETFILCAKTIAEAIPHVRHVWRPSQFALWTDPMVAPWLTTIGEKSPQSKMNQEVMAFANEFLEPLTLRNLLSSSNEDMQLDLPLPNVPVLCKILILVSKEAVNMFDKEDGMDPLTFARLEELLRIVMGFVEEHSFSTIGGVGRRSARLNKAQSVEEIAALRKVSATINELVTKTAERMLLLAEEEDSRRGTSTSLGINFQSKTSKMETFYVRMQLIGKKSDRFLESTTIPTFLDWDVPYICRVPSGLIWKAMNGERVKYAKKHMKSAPTLQQFIEVEICTTFAEPYILFLEEELSESCIKFCTEIPEDREVEKNESTTLYFIVVPVRSIRSSRDHHNQSKKFHCKSMNDGTDEITVANHFPCALSRQATLITRTLQ